MQTRTDSELLLEYAAEGSESAFGEIVRRYADFVYSAALRQVNDPEQARDVAQVVFSDLARKAGSLRRDVVLIGWLCNGARLAAFEHLRKDRRRLQRERQAMEFHDPSPDAPADWSAVLPALDDALAHLGDADRDALLLRFFKNESLSAVGTALGVSEDAAQKRVSRALEKLRVLLAGRGITTTEAALSGILVSSAAQTAPAGLAASLTAHAIGQAGAAAGGSLLKLFGVPLKTAAAVLIVGAGVAGLALANLQARREVRDLRGANAGLAAQLEALRGANEQLSGATNELARLRRDARDVLRLRAETARLQQELADKNASAVAAPAIATNALADAQVTVQASFISIPANSTLISSAGVTADLERQLIDLADDPAFGIDVLGISRVTTLSGRQAQMQITPQDATGNSASGTIYTNVGITLDVVPVCSAHAPSVDLQFVAMISDVVDGSAANDGSFLVLQSQVMSNHVNAPDDQTILLGGTLPQGGRWSRPKHGSDTNETGSRQLAVFLRATIIDAAGNRVYPGANPSATEAETTPASRGVLPGVSSASSASAATSTTFHVLRKTN